VVCSSQADCASGTCTSYTCPFGDPIRTCTKPTNCN
jgi:hypothetical protein